MSPLTLTLKAIDNIYRVAAVTLQSLATVSVHTEEFGILD